eukprot:960087-Prymnesium_polylepis.1
MRRPASLVALAAAAAGTALCRGAPALSAPNGPTRTGAHGHAQAARAAQNRQSPGSKSISATAHQRHKR